MDGGNAVMGPAIVAMSGGVDSSVAAALLRDEGLAVSGLTMVLTAEDPATDPAVRNAAAVCEFLGIPHEAIDVREVFEREVLEPFASEYAAGRTPNPCVRCNERVKFGWLLAYARERGAAVLATGHYARIVVEPGRPAQLLRALDPAKDQSYFLYPLTPETLEQVRFPLGELTKGRVREIAEELGLPAASAPESQDTCFVGHEGHEALIAARIPGAALPGPIVDATGARVGTHRGLAHYTVGQRKGLGIAAREPLFVLALDPSRNSVVVGPGRMLDVRTVEAAPVTWHDARDDVACLVQTRYRMEPVAARARVDADGLHIVTKAPIRGVAPGQAVVCYEEERVLGGGVILSAL
jgi:tRNA-specific 2-thiouridylase